MRGREKITGSEKEKPDALKETPGLILIGRLRGDDRSLAEREGLFRTLIIQ